MAGHHAFVVLGGLLTLLVFIGEAVRDAFDPRKIPPGRSTPMSLVQVDNLTVAFGPRIVVNRVSFTSIAAKRWRWSAKAAPASRSPPCRCCNCCRRVRLPTGRVVVDGQSVIGAGAGLLRRLRGGVAGMVFQEPMTSLNPLSRIGSQIAERSGCISASPRRRRASGSSSY